MVNYRTIKGTHDILPEQCLIWKHVENIVYSIMQDNGYGEIRTPAFENTELFIRGIGNETDIVNKEMYSWIDQGGNNLTLKPELTAPVVRAYLQHKLSNNSPIHRLYYFDSLFRRERPQKGRQRQFYQFGAEAIGSPHPEQDVEIISLAYNIYQELGIKDINVKLNSIGSANIRPKYLEKLRKSLKNKKNKLCKACKNRYEKNALRIFDCKNIECQNILEDVPLIFNDISKDDKFHFNEITSYLNEINIPYTHEHKLVRGLDYYSHTTFEITSNLLGAQNALCGGGRYNGLIKQLGGKSTPAVGFAAGVERLILALNSKDIYNSSTDIYFIHLGDKVISSAIKIANEIRKHCKKIVVLETLRRSLKSQMREADRSNAKLTLILGEEELLTEKIIVKEMKNGTQKKISIKKLTEFINSYSK